MHSAISITYPFIINQMTIMQGKLKRIGEALLNSKDHRSVKKDQVEDGDEKAAWDRLENLQSEL